MLILIFLTCGDVFPLAKVHGLEFVEGGSLDFVVFRTDLIQQIITKANKVNSSMDVKKMMKHFLSNQ